MLTEFSDPEEGLLQYLSGGDSSYDELEEEEEQDIVGIVSSEEFIELINASEEELATELENANIPPTMLEKASVPVPETAVSENAHETIVPADQTSNDEIDKGIDTLIREARRSARVPKPNRLPDFIYSVVENTPMEILNGLLEDAKVQGEEGKRAAAKLELTKLLKEYKCKCIRPVKFDRGKMKEIIRGKMFVKEKRDSSDNFKINKGRYVARGDLRKNKPMLPQQTFSPTTAYPTVVATLNIALSRNYAHMSGDFECAYLNADFEKDEIHMRLEPNMAEMAVEIDAAYKEFIEEDGALYVVIEKALYGLQESARLWYQVLCKSLIDDGFKRSNYDHACFFKKNGDDLVIVLVYVDDLLMVGPKDEVLHVKEYLGNHFKFNTSELSPKSIDYVGVKIEYDGKEHVFKLSQPSMVSKVICRSGENFRSSLLLKVCYRETEAESVKSEDVTTYRSQVMELNYLSKTRPDIKVALGYLATRMQEPSIGDFAKLQRLKGYILDTKDFCMRIKPTGAIQVYASSDASFGTFQDGKSNSGIVITVGYPNAPILAKSTKQKSVANSSTSAELIAFSTTLEEVLWTMELLTEMGFKQETVEIEHRTTSRR